MKATLKEGLCVIHMNNDLLWILRGYNANESHLSWNYFYIFLFQFYLIRLKNDADLNSMV